MKFFSLLVLGLGLPAVLGFTAAGPSRSPAFSATRLSSTTDADTTPRSSQASDVSEGGPN